MTTDQRRCCSTPERCKQVDPITPKADQNLLFWQWTPSKPGGHLQTYSPKTSPRRVEPVTWQTPSFWQGLRLHGPVRRRSRRGAESARPAVRPRQLFPLAAARLTALRLIAGFAVEAVWADADDALPLPRHAGAAVAAVIHLAEVTCGRRRSPGSRLK